MTGGSGAIGRATATALVARGATVIAGDVGIAVPVTGSDLTAACTEVHLDVTDKAEVEAVVTRIVERLQRIDILVNVAGIVSHGTAQHLAEDEWDRVMRINLKGTFLCCQAVMATMKARRYGRIVNVGSLVGKNGGSARPWLHPEEQLRSGNVAYGVSKAGVHAMTSFLAKELAAHGVTVNAVAPGPVATGMTARYPEALMAQIPVGRMGSLDDVVEAMVYLASPRASYVTGEVLDINGGMWCD